MRTLLISLALFVVSGTTPATQTVDILNGDVNLDGRICMDDPVHIIYHLYRDGRALPCGDAADADRSGSVTITDAVVLLRYIFNGEYLFDCPVTCLRDDGGYQEPYTY
jgi:hypothetical protein